MTHKARIAAATLALAAGLLVTPALAQTAAAEKTVSNPKVGTIDGYYVPGTGYKDYGGKMKPSAVEGGHCVAVERKSGGGVWTENYVHSGGLDSQARSCDPSTWLVWQITLDAKVADTIGIRLRVFSGVYSDPPSYVVLCGSKDICLAMR